MESGSTALSITAGERVRLRQARLDDAAFLRRLMNAPGWLRYIGDRQIRTHEDARAYIQNSLISSYRTHGFGLYVVEHSEEAIGLCGLLQRDYLDAPDLGFAILPEYERQGLTREAIELTLEYAAQSLQLRELLAIVLEENLPSQKLLRRCGFKPSGTVDSDKGDELLLYRQTLVCRSEEARSQLQRDQ